MKETINIKLGQRYSLSGHHQSTHTHRFSLLSYYLFLYSIHSPYFISSFLLFTSILLSLFSLLYLLHSSIHYLLTFSLVSIYSYSILYSFTILYSLFIHFLPRLHLFLLSTYHESLGLFSKSFLCTFNHSHDVSTRQIHQQRFILVIHDWKRND